MSDGLGPLSGIGGGDVIGSSVERSGSPLTVKAVANMRNQPPSLTKTQRRVPVVSANVTVRSDLTVVFSSTQAEIARHQHLQSSMHPLT